MHYFVKNCMLFINCERKKKDRKRTTLSLSSVGNCPKIIIGDFLSLHKIFTLCVWTDSYNWLNRMSHLKNETLTTHVQLFYSNGCWWFLQLLWYLQIFYFYLASHKNYTSKTHFVYEWLLFQSFKVCVVSISKGFYHFSLFFTWKYI